MTRGREDKRARRLSEWLVLLSIMTLQTHAIETVNVADFCGQTVQGDGMIVRSHKESRKYYFVTMGTDCHLTMQSATPRDKVQFHFRFFLVYSLLRVSPFSSVPLFAESAKGPAPPGPAPPGPAPPGPAPPGPTWPELRLEPTPGEDQGDPCHTGSYIQFYDGRDKTAPPIGPPLCGKSLPRPVLSTGNYLTLRLVTRGTQPRVDFVGDFTSFRLGFNQSECRGEPYFHCHNGKCIPMSLVCNDDKGIDNCGDGTDLQDYPGCISVSSTASAPRSRTAPPVVLPNTPTLTASTPEKCSGLSDIPNLDSVNDSQPPASLLVLYVLLGVGAGTVLLCWCCWSPGWFVWRVSVCRFLHCCNSCCASCQLCGRSCTQTKEHRLTKVTPQVMPQGTTPPAPTATTMAV